MVEDISLIKNIKPIQETICESCIYGKQTKLPFATSKSKIHISRPLFIPMFVVQLHLLQLITSNIL